MEKQSAARQVREGERTRELVAGVPGSVGFSWRHAPPPACGKGHARSESGDGEEMSRAALAGARQRRVLPNAPCPCGSALKFKKCCGKGGVAGGGARLRQIDG